MNLETMKLGDIVESLSWQNPNLSLHEKIEVARPQIFKFSYPYWTDEHKKRFETLFIRKFYETEIGFETEGRFFFELENWLLENMEYYVKLLKSQIWEEQIKNPLSNYDLAETFKSLSNKTGNENTTVSQEETNNVSRETISESSGTSFDRNIGTDTPQNRLAITTEDGQGVIEYASRIDEDKSTSSANQSANESQTGSSATDSTGNVVRSENENNEHTLTRVGNIGIMTYDQLLNGYRSIFMRVEKQMLDEMRAELFMLVY